MQWRNALPGEKLAGPADRLRYPVDWESVWVEFFDQAMREIHEWPYESPNLIALASQVLLGDRKTPNRLAVAFLHNAAKLQNARLKVGIE